jgi:uncharacterized protein YkwD
MKALCRIALLAMLVAAVAPAASAEPAEASTDPADRMIDAMNEARAKHGIAPLRAAPKLAGTAHGYARHLIRSNSFGHGSSYLGAGFERAGEILAMNRGWSRRAAPTLRMWLHSASHAALILEPSFRFVGVGPARGRYGGAPTTIWVAHFGAH